ncbi:hypothetical protein [Microbaculum marinisediminis]|uniref:Uncharacterized protein n=1 Tax=Microbaculum marinisediminis TaxID=2931392 RepID=A0AAW5QWV0_9HYPH|nr:hypothetical protein [Microbaculum sp. A6E488]MCT8970873.1 hypothetical protein [Microbaculum sp. A6E488]
MTNIAVISQGDLIGLTVPHDTGGGFVWWAASIATGQGRNLGEFASEYEARQAVLDAARGVISMASRPRPQAAPEPRNGPCVVLPFKRHQSDAASERI